MKSENVKNLVFSEDLKLLDLSNLACQFKFAKSLLKSKKTHHVILSKVILSTVILSTIILSTDSKRFIKQNTILKTFLNSKLECLPPR